MIPNTQLRLATKTYQAAISGLSAFAADPTSSMMLRQVHLQNKTVEADHKTDQNKGLD